MVEKTKALVALPSNLELVGILVPDQAGNKEIETVCTELRGHLIDFYTMNMDDLAIIAKHRVLPVPTLLIISNSKVVGRIVKDIPTTAELRKIIAKLG